MEIQDFLTAAIQNIVVLISQPKHRISKSHVQAVWIADYRKRKGGKVSLKSDQRKNANGTFTFTVDDVTLDAWTYYPSANIEDSDSIMK